jgi:activator of 2-hydroxyglutaryl-CoA dehydratase
VVAATLAETIGVSIDQVSPGGTADSFVDSEAQKTIRDLKLRAAILFQGGTKLQQSPPKVSPIRR